jgi:hypothetical protein
MRRNLLRIGLVSDDHVEPRQNGDELSAGSHSRVGSQYQFAVKTK